MGHNQASALFVAALLVSTAVSPSAGAPEISIEVNGVTITGSICCTSTGNCGKGNSKGMASVTIKLKCTNIFGRITTVGQATTRSGGSFNITVPHLKDLLLSKPIMPCEVSVKLPLLVCPALSTTTGSLSSTVKSVGTVISEVWGKLQHGTITGFKHVK